MEATRDISQKANFLDIIGSALEAAQSVIDAESYTLGILNEKKDMLDLYSNPPVALPGRSYMEEGSLIVDSTTTFGRVVLVRTAVSGFDDLV